MQEKTKEFREYYLKEFSFNDGEKDIIFNIVNIDTAVDKITVAISNAGKISVCDFDLKSDKDKGLFFEFGVMIDKIAIDDFETIEEDE